MHLTKEDIKQLEKIKRLNIINSITGIKPANLIGTISEAGQTNLAIFSSIVHLGSNPAMIAFIMRPTTDVPRHTYNNIQSTGLYTINHIHESFIEQAHYTSAKFSVEESEFDTCGLTTEYIDGFKAPFVKESQIQLGMKFLEEIPIKANNTLMIVGEIQHLILPDQAVSKEGYINLASIQNVGISGLNTYYSLQKIGAFPYARVSELPKF